ncbi:MAG: hypothetical protein EON93_14835, partial [Burkholderiales bacterium]
MEGANDPGGAPRLKRLEAPIVAFKIVLLEECFNPGSNAICQLRYARGPRRRDNRARLPDGMVGVRVFGMRRGLRTPEDNAFQTGDWTSPIKYQNIATQLAGAVGRFYRHVATDSFGRRAQSAP